MKKFWMKVQMNFHLFDQMLSSSYLCVCIICKENILRVKIKFHFLICNLNFTDILRPSKLGPGIIGKNVNRSFIFVPYLAHILKICFCKIFNKLMSSPNEPESQNKSSFTRTFFLRDWGEIPTYTFS